MNFFHNKIRISLLKTGLLISMSISLSLPSNPLYSQEKTPEELLSKVNSDLNRLRTEIEAARNVTKHSRYDSHRILADKHLKNALKYFYSKDYYAAISLFNQYLNTVQIPVRKNYLLVRSKLGISYESVGRENLAIANYLNYFSTFLSNEQKNYDEMLDVLRRLVSISTKEKFKNKKEINQLVSSLVSIELPKHLKSQILYYSAKSVAQLGNSKLASEWLIIASRDKTNANLRARSLYLRSILAISAKDWKAAEVLLKRAIDSEEKIDSEILSTCFLALARVAVRQKRLQLAIKHYDQVDKDTPQHKDALYEKIYLLFELGQYKKSRNLAALYIANYPDNLSAFRLRTLIAFLDLKAGDLNAARKGIYSSNLELVSISNWLDSFVMSKIYFTYDDLLLIQKRTNSYLRNTSFLDKGLDLFSKLNLQNYRLAMLDNEVKNMTYTLGSFDLVKIRPSWNLRALQLDKLSKRTLETGHRLAAAERYLYTNLLSETEMQFLKASEQRRTEFFSPIAKLKRQRSRWQYFSEYLSLSSQLAELTSKVSDLKSTLASINYINATHGNKLMARQDLALLAKKLDRQKNNLQKATSLLKKAQISSLVNQGYHSEARNLLIQYSMALVDEAGVLQNVTSRLDIASDRIVARDISSLWDQWKFAIKGVHSHFTELESEIRLELAATINRLEQFNKRRMQLKEQSEKIRQNLRQELGKSSELLISEFKTQIEKRLQKQKKWAADIEWLESAADNKKLLNSQKKYSLETQILKDNLEDLYYGVY